MGARAGEEYVPERDEDEEDAEQVLHELDEDKTNAEEVEEEAQQEAAEVVVGEVIRRASVVETVRDMLQHKNVELTHLTTLTDHEREALEFLQTVIEGRTKSGAFVYAERRLEQLNLLLADLQPLLSVGMVQGLESTLQEVVDGFDQLRHELELLEEAEEEVQHLEEEKGEGAEDDDDDDKDDDDQGDDDQGDDEKPVEAGTPTEGEGDKKPPLWERLWNRKKPPQGGGGGGGDEGGGGRGGGA